jgi:hypothetical protein
LVNVQPLLQVITAIPLVEIEDVMGALQHCAQVRRRVPSIRDTREVGRAQLQCGDRHALRRTSARAEISRPGREGT